MATAYSDRLSATDLVFLEMEDANVSMHIGAVRVFDGAPLRARLAPPRPWTPRPAPGGTRLLVDELARRASAPVDVLRRAPDEWREPRRTVENLWTAISHIGEATAQLKRSGRVQGGELLSAFSDRVLPPLAGWLSWLAARARMYNLSVTNVPGPQVPV